MQDAVCGLFVRRWQHSMTTTLDCVCMCARLRLAVLQGNVFTFLQQSGGRLPESVVVPMILEPTMSALNYIHGLVRAPCAFWADTCVTAATAGGSLRVCRQQKISPSWGAL